MKKYLIDYENAHWCGGQLNVVVNAMSPDEAMEKAEVHMDECQRELFSSELEEALEENPDFDTDFVYVINSVEEFDETHPDWVFYKDPTQSEFYPEIVAQ